MCMSTARHREGHQPVFPNEILLHVISLLDRESLILAVVVNCLFADEIERSLHRSLHITAAEGSDEDVQRALASKPHRAAYVRFLFITLDNVNSSLFTSDPILTTFVRLQSLTILPGTNTHASPALDALTQCHFYYLTHFRSTWSLDDPVFRTFLSAHATLTSVELSKASSTFTLPTAFPDSLLPRLETLDGYWSNFVRLVRGRLVSSVAIESANADSYVPPNDSRSYYPSLQTSRKAEGDVQRLSIHVKDIRGDTVSLASRLVPGLGALELVDCSAARKDPNEAFVIDHDHGFPLREVGDALRSFDRLVEFGVNRPLPEHVVATLGELVPSPGPFQCREGFMGARTGRVLDGKQRAKSHENDLFLVAHHIRFSGGTALLESSRISISRPFILSEFLS